MNYDIKTIEEYLWTLPLTEEFEFECFSQEEQEYRCFYSLSWAYHAGKMQIITIRKTDGKSSQRRLCEAPLNLRIRLYNHLPEFVDKLLSQLDRFINIEMLV